MVLAGCIDLTDEDVAEIVDELVDIAGCNDATAYNYDENATNNNACLTELVLKDSVTQFIHLVNEGPEWGETAGIVMAGSEVDDDGATTSFSTTGAMSPDGMYTMVVMDMGMMSIEMGELITENADGTTNIVTTWMGNTFQMNSAAIFDETWNEQTYNQDDDDFADSDTDGNDLVIHAEGDDGNGDDSGIDARDGHAGNEDGNNDGMDDGHDDHDDGMDDHDDDHDDGMDDHDDDSDGVSWEPYHGGYCEWEGNPDDEQDVWSCKDDASDLDWDTWWYYCELHGEDWYCTDDYGQDSEYQHSAGYSNYDHDGHDHGDHDDHDGHDDHDDDMDDDMGDDFDMGLPDTDVSIPDNFDPATAMFELGLVTANGYSFSTTLDDSMGHSVTMTFTLSLAFEVTQMVMVETDASGMSSTSSITIMGY